MTNGKSTALTPIEADSFRSQCEYFGRWVRSKSEHRPAPPHLMSATPRARWIRLTPGMVTHPSALRIRDLDILSSFEPRHSLLDIGHSQGGPAPIMLAIARTECFSANKFLTVSGPIKQIKFIKSASALL